MILIARALSLLLTILLLAACAGGPKLEAGNAESSLSPQQAVRQGEALKGRRVLWGGAIVATRNLPKATQIEVLAYPLDSSQRPQLGKEPLGRFLAYREGYLESADYTPGRLLTVVGPLNETREGQIGEATYTYPVVQVEQLYLWPRETTGYSSEPQFHFGVGIGVNIR